MPRYDRKYSKVTKPEDNLKTLQKKLKRYRELRGITTYDLYNVFFLEPRTFEAIEEGDMNVLFTSFLRYLEMIDCEIVVRPKKLRRSVTDVKHLGKMLGVDMEAMLDQANKKTP